jgi:hypothetical protein
MGIITLYDALKAIFNKSAEEIATEIVDGDMNIPYIIELLESLDPELYEHEVCEHCTDSHKECEYLGRGFNLNECLIFASDGEQCPYGVDRRQTAINGILRELTDSRLGYIADKEDNYEY